MDNATEAAIIWTTAERSALIRFVKRHGKYPAVSLGLCAHQPKDGAEFMSLLSQQIALGPSDACPNPGHPFL